MDGEEMSEVLEFDPRARLIKGLNDYDNSRARSNQKEIGPSSLGDCRRKVYHQILGTPETNHDTDRLAALMGTAFHRLIEEAMALQDNPFKKRFTFEEAISWGNMPMHIDFYEDEFFTLVDWKTTKLKNMKDFPSQGNIWQGQNYAMAKVKAGFPVKKVAVVVIPRDGRMDQIQQWVGDYDESVALEGQAWLAEIRQMAAEKKKPLPERSAFQFCKNYCVFYDPTAEIGCPGK